MERSAAPAPGTPAVVFQDGLGDRRHVVDPMGHEPLEVLCLRPELSSVPSFEFALRERVTQLAQFRHASYGRVRSIERLGARDATLAIVSDSTPGIRLSELLRKAEERRVPVDINAALCLLRQVVPAVAALHEVPGEMAHGAIGPERLVVTPDARLVIVEYVAATALEQLRQSREHYWTDLRVALPRTAGLSRFDQRVDATQVGVVALSLLLGRLLQDDEYPNRVADLVASTWAVSARGGFEPLPPGLRAWLGRALQLDPRNAFASAVEARVELDKVLGDSDLPMTSQSLADFLVRYHAAVGGPTLVSAPPLRSVAPVPPVSAPSVVRAQEPVNAPAMASAPRPVLQPAPELVALPLAEPVNQPVVSQPVVSQPVVTPVAVAPQLDFDVLVRSQQKPDPHARPIESVKVAVVMPQADSHEEDLVTEPATRQGRGWPKLAAVAAIAIIVTGGFVARRYIGGAPAPAVTGTLTVTTNPAGATIAVDGEARGTTPVTLTLSPGAHQIQLQGSGEPRTLPVTITAGAEATQYVELPVARATGGQLMVKTEPAGAQVTVDGIARGESPLTIGDLAPGEHAVSLVGQGGSSRQTVTIERGAMASLVVSLGSTEGSLQSGWISVASPVDVQLFEKNRLLGTSATDQIMVTSGRHEIDFVNESLGYRVSRTVTVPPGKVASIGLDLPKGQLAVNAVPWAEVWIDGEKAGDTPIGNLSLTIGPHDILFRHPDLGEQHHTAMVTLKGAGRLSVDLRKK